MTTQTTAASLAKHFYLMRPDAIELLRRHYLQKSELTHDQATKKYWNTKASACSIALESKVRS